MTRGEIFNFEEGIRDISSLLLEDFGSIDPSCIDGSLPCCTWPKVGKIFMQLQFGPIKWLVAVLLTFSSRNDYYPLYSRNFNTFNKTKSVNVIIIYFNILLISI